MDLPLAFILIAVNMLLVAGGLLLFLPEGPLPLKRKEYERLLDKYGKYLLAAVAVLIVHLLLVQLDDEITRALGWDFAPSVSALERGFVPWLQNFQATPLDYFFSIMYIIIHPVMLYFPILLFILSDEERPAKAQLLMYPVGYLLAIPFYVFYPATNVYVFHNLQSPVFELFPQLTTFFYAATTENNTFPSLHTAFAILIANAARYSRNRHYRYWAYFYATSVVISTLYLTIHWGVDVLGGIIVALIVATFTKRFISTERLALQRVKPTPEEAHSVSQSAQRLIARVTHEMESLGIVPERMMARSAARTGSARAGTAMLVGSVAKDTYLRDNVDFDAFALFPTSVPREELAEKGLAIGRAVLDDPEEKYAEHPYLHGYWEGIKADVVPCYAVDTPQERITAVDRTPFHTEFVMTRMQREQRDQVRLLKAFMKGVGVYGAEAATQGFSGYLCELLVLKFGTFRSVLEAAAGWKPGTFLVLDRYEGDVKFSDPLVFLDPIDPKRNVASAVSADTLALFAESCRAYIRREGLSFFFPRQVVPRPPDELALTLRRRRGDFILLRLKRPEDVLEDHLHDQLRKAEGAIIRLLEQHGFEVRRITHELGNDVRILVELPRGRLPDTVTHVGPPVKSRAHAERFRKTWTDHPSARSPVYEEEGRLKVERLREYRRAEDLLRDKLNEYDLGKHIGAALKQGYEVYAGPDVVQEENAKLLTKHLLRKKPWEM